MTLKRVARITGYEIRQLPPVVGYNQFRFGAYDGDRLVAECDNYQPQMALKGLVTIVYKIHSQAVFAAQGWKCLDCGQVKPLQIHHIVHRSKGRNDKMQNLKALCYNCHQLEHGRSR